MNRYLQRRIIKMDLRGGNGQLNLIDFLDYFAQLYCFVLLTRLNSTKRQAAQMGNKRNFRRNVN